MISLILLHFYIIGCVFALLIWNIYLYDNNHGDFTLVIKQLKCDKIIILSIIFSWLTVIIQILKYKKNYEVY